MKKTIIIAITFLLIACTTLSLAGCIFDKSTRSTFCDPKGKEWHNFEHFPSIGAPCSEVYEGGYSIKIDDNGNVEFKLITGEVLKGTLTILSVKKKTGTRSYISIQFENGKTVSGDCIQNKSGRFLDFIYENRIYQFSDKIRCTKEEMDVYRGQLVEFLIGVYKTGVFPTQEEIANNELYRKFTGYSQVDPHHGGPIRYKTAERAKVLNVFMLNDIASVYVDINGEVVECTTDGGLPKCYEIKNGTIQRIEVESKYDVKKGECLISREKKYSYENDKTTYEINDIIYVESN